MSILGTATSSQYMKIFTDSWNQRYTLILVDLRITLPTFLAATHFRMPAYPEIKFMSLKSKAVQEYYPAVHRSIQLR